MQTSLNLIDSQPNALIVLSALCLFSEKSASVAQLENRTVLDTDDIEDALSFLEEHSYIIVSANDVNYITEKGLQYVNEKTYSDFKLR
jgi:Fe-S cluster assembly iron-binding protein IscA